MRTLLVLLLASCSTAELPKIRADEVARRASAKPQAVLFSIVGCRYCAIAERGFVGAAREIGPRVDFAKVMVEDEDLDALTRRYALQPTMPQARLLLPGGRWEPLPLTREGAVVARAVGEALTPKP